MQTSAHPSAIAALAVALGGAACAGGCALVYSFDYNDEDTSSGAGGRSSSGIVASSGSVGGGGGGVGDLPNAAWAQRFGGAGYDVVGHPGVDIGPKNGEVFITGLFQGSIDLGKGPLTSPNFGVFLAKLDPASGEAIWSTHVADTMGNTEVDAVAATPDDDVVVAGRFDVQGLLDDMVPVKPMGLHDIFLASYQNDGTYLWGKTFGDAADQVATAVAVDPTGMIYLTGQFHGAFLGGNMGCTATAVNPSGDGFIAQLNPSGDCIWLKTWSSSAPTMGVRGQSLAAVIDGVLLGGEFADNTSFAGAGYTADPAGEGFVAKLDTDGNVLFVDLVPGALDTYVASNPNTGGAFYGASLLMKSPTPDAVTVGELDDQWMLSQSTTYNNPMSTNLESITSTPLGDLFFSGSALGTWTVGPQTATNHGGRDMLLVRLSTPSTPVGSMEFGDVADQYGRNVRADAFGNVYLYGDFKGSVDFGHGVLTSAGDYDMVIAKFVFTPP